jgi:pseudouridine kinase
MSGPVVCIGASFVDELLHTTNEILPATTNLAVVSKTAGGVGRNIAHQLAQLEVPVQLISVFGNDSDGDWLKEICIASGVRLDASLILQGLSGKYTGILNADGSLFTAFLTNTVNDLLTSEHLELHIDLLKTASWLLADTNISVATLEWLLTFSNRTDIPFIIEPVSVLPARKLKGVDLNGLYLITPNEDELPALCSEKAVTTEQQVEELLHRGVQYIWLHNGEQGSTLYSKEKTVTLAAATADVLDCTGAGDASVSGFVLGKYLGMDDLDCLKLAHTLSTEILQVSGAVSENLSQQKLLSLVSKYYPIT